ncbi:hypothetical protein UlMin_033071 [Ulmus minor]
MPHRTRPMTALLVFTGVNIALASTITPAYDFVCFLPYWERRWKQLIQSRGRSLIFSIIAPVHVATTSDSKLYYLFVVCDLVAR